VSRKKSSAARINSKTCPATEHIGWHVLDIEVVNEDKPDQFTTITTYIECCRNCDYARLWQREKVNTLPFLVDNIEIIIIDPDKEK
jgi:hypothetical protein